MVSHKEKFSVLSLIPAETKPTRGEEETHEFSYNHIIHQVEFVMHLQIKSKLFLHYKTINQAKFPSISSKKEFKKQL